MARLLKISALSAIGYAVILALFEAYRNWGDWQWWPFWVVDYVAATVLFLGGVAYLRRGIVGLMTGAWGFSTAMMSMSLFSHIDSLRQGDAAAYGPGGSLSEVLLTGLIGMSTVVAGLGFLIGIIASLRA